MKTTLIYRAIRYGYRLSKRTYYTLVQKFEKKENRLLFVFAGRTEGWPGLGHSMYKNYPEFASCIKHCNQILLDNGGSEILSYFEGPVNERYFDNELKFTCITAIQLALVELCSNKGIFPNAVMGVSMGEVPAAYAAGALTKDEALKIAVSYMSIYKEMGMQYAFLFLNLGIQEAAQFCKECPVSIEIIYEDSTQAVLIACHKEDISQLKNLINQRKVHFKIVSDRYYTPYHTSLIKPHHRLAKKDIELRPLKCDYYSSVLGKVIPKNAILPSDYWHNLACIPVLFNTTLQAVIQDGYDLFLQIGPSAISERQWNNLATSNTIRRFNTFQLKALEEPHFKSIVRQLSTLKFKPTSASIKDQSHILNAFLQEFDLHSLDQTNQLEYLRKQGPIHFLPVHNAWMILGYDDTEQVLKNPEVYSSSPYSYIDPVLIGADPILHKVTRGILQPLFSSQVIAEMGKVAFTIAEETLNTLILRDEFDLVRDFSDPLSQTVLCRFMGFTPEEEIEVKKIVAREFYWQHLGTYFSDNFDLRAHAGEENMLGKMQACIANNELSFPDAVSLLRIILTAGLATTSTLISTTLSIINKVPELIEQINGNDQLISKYIEECLRLETPAHYVRRITTQPVEILGKQLPENTFIYLNLRSANRDPDHFSDPEVFSITRPAKRHLVFGTGIHQCIGMGMARSEARSVIQVVLSRLDELKAYNWDEPEYYKDSEIQHMTTLKLKKKI